MKSENLRISPITENMQREIEQGTEATTLNQLIFDDFVSLRLTISSCISNIITNHRAIPIVIRILVLHLMLVKYLSYVVHESEYQQDQWFGMMENVHIAFNVNCHTTAQMFGVFLIRSIIQNAHINVDNKC